MNTNYHAHIDSTHSLLDLKIGELIQYKDLIWLYTKKDLVRRYKQTILGPMWIVIHPIFNTLIYAFIFGGIAGMSTDGVPRILFYMAGNSIWTFFSSSVNKCSNTFLGNSGVFGKVYFPRLAIYRSLFDKLSDMAAASGDDDMALHAEYRHWPHYCFNYSKIQGSHISSPVYRKPVDVCNSCCLSFVNSNE